MSVHQPLDGKASAIMVFLCVIWGIQQVAIKGAAGEISPVLQIGLRSGMAALLVWLLIRFRHQPLRLSRASFVPGMIAGTLFALEFLFVAEGLRFTAASHMAVFLYTAPAFAAIGLQICLPEERLAWPQWLGIAIAFAGIGIAFLSGNSGAQGSNMLLGDMLGLLAGITWGATTVVVRCTSLTRCPAAHTLFFQLAGAFILLSLYSLISGEHHFAPGVIGYSSLLFQTVIVTFASYLVWFGLLRRYLASQLGVLSFLTPVFGVIAGVIMLGEKMRPAFIHGALLILAGIVVVSGYSTFLRWLRKRHRPV